jgi:hypothetical protein
MHHFISILIAGLFTLSVHAAEQAKPAPKPVTDKPEVVKEPEKKPDANVPKEKIPEPKLETKKPEPAPEKYGKQGGALQPLELGPKLLIGVLPAVSIEGKLWNLFGFNVDVTWLPTISISGTSVGMLGWDADVRWFPFKGAFFIGGGIGNLSVTASQTKDILGTSVTATANITDLFVLAHIGWRWVGHSGFFWGMDIGAQFALNVTSPLTHNASVGQQADPLFTDMQNQLNNVADIVRRYPMPVLAFCVGYYF